MTRARVGVLVSGGGTNLQALIDATREPGFPAEIAVVLSNRADAFGLERARLAGIPAIHLPSKGMSREAYDAALADALGDVDWVCLAGFMRLVGPAFLERFPWRVLNIHPALLPAFPGLHAQEQALNHGVCVSGATVHLVDAGCDTGPIVIQGVVPVLAGDDVATLSARILTVEHAIYPRALRWAAEGRLTVAAGKLVPPSGAVRYTFYSYSADAPASAT